MTGLQYLVLLPVTVQLCGGTGTGNTRGCNVGREEDIILEWGTMAWAQRYGGSQSLIGNLKMPQW